MRPSAAFSVWHILQRILLFFAEQKTDSQPTTNGTNFEWLNQYGGESVISGKIDAPEPGRALSHPPGVPHWSGLTVELDNGAFLGASTETSEISNFSSTLDAKKGTTSWSYLWSPSDVDDQTFEISYTIFAHKLYISQAIIQLEITPSADVNVSIVNVFDGTSAVRTQFEASGMDDESKQLFTAVKPVGIDNITAWIYAAMEGTAEVDLTTVDLVTNKPYLGRNDSSVAQAATARLKAGKSTVVTKYVGAATSDGFSDPRALAKNSSLTAMKTGFDQSLIFHAVEWAEVFAPGSVDNYTYAENNTLPDDEFIIESQITAVLNPYYLLQNTLSTNALANVHGAPIDTNSISVGGLASDSYGGLVFWDAEIWMQPGSYFAACILSYPAKVVQVLPSRSPKLSAKSQNTGLNATPRRKPMLKQRTSPAKPTRAFPAMQLSIRGRAVALATVPGLDPASITNTISMAILPKNLSTIGWPAVTPLFSSRRCSLCTSPLLRFILKRSS